MVNKLLEIKDFKRDSKLLSMKLMNMFSEYFNLRVQFRLGNVKQSHLLRKFRRNIASIKTVISQNFKYIDQMNEKKEREL